MTRRFKKKLYYPLSSALDGYSSLRADPGIMQLQPYVIAINVTPSHCCNATSESSTICFQHVLNNAYQIISKSDKYDMIYNIYPSYIVAIS